VTTKKSKYIRVPAARPVCIHDRVFEGGRPLKATVRRAPVVRRPIQAEDAI